MCGLTGYFSLDHSFDPGRFALANNVIRHRGPDDHGFVTFGRSQGTIEHRDEDLADYQRDDVVIGGLGFRRLAIIDLTSAGHQPMSSEKRDLWIVFNGEVYNYIEIREELKLLGHRFRSDSDTEVVLAAYREWGEDCQLRLNGMWAFAIYDADRKEVFCSRDRFGIKPFNFFLDRNRFAFGSEVKQLLQLVDDCSDINESTVYDFLIYGAKNHGDNTFRARVSELRGGECMTVSLDKSSALASRRRLWWDLHAANYTGSMQQAGEQFLELLTDSVRIRLRSDVETGTALSGGLDSTGIVSLIDQLTSTPQKVFTVVSRDKASDESAAAMQMIEKYALIGHSIEFGEQDVRELERISYFHDQPVNSAGAFGGWILQRKISETGVIVNINGQGADELMGGYSKPPHALNYLDSMHAGNVIQAQRELLAGFRNSSKSLTGSANVFSRDLTMYGLRREALKWANRSRRSFLNHDFHAKYHADSRYLALDNAEFDSSSIIKRHAYQELRRTQLPFLLHNVDRDSMAHSLEARVPFLDYRIAEFVFSLPPHMLLKNGYTKYVYREAMQGRIPDKLLWNNNKKGFATPRNDYLSIGKDYFTELLSDFRNHPIVDTRFVSNALQGKIKSGKSQLWRSLCYLIWCRQNEQS